jgi:hypothetical protein
MTGLPEKSFADRRQPEFAAPARKQRTAERLFEALDLLADRALRDVEPVGRDRHAAAVGDRDKGS